MKINVTLDDELINRLDELKAKSCDTRSGLIAQAVRMYLDKLAMTSAVQRIADVLEQSVKNGVVTPEQKEEIDKFQMLANLMLSR